MRQFMILLCCGLLVSCNTTKNVLIKTTVATITPKLSPEEEIPILTIAAATHSFDTIVQGKPVKHNFVFNNVGKVPVMLGEVTTPCGCTTPIWDKGLEIKPGASTNVEVEFNAANEGAFQKKLTIYYNNAYMLDFSITGFVKASDVQDKANDK